MKRYFAIGISMIGAVALALGAWFGLGWVQVQRADSSLESANAHIDAANRLAANINMEQLGQESFTSLDRINQAAEASRVMLPLIDQAAADVKSAETEAEAAADMLLLTQWYGNYLERKQQVASLRGRQLAVVKETAERLQQLYAAGPVIFSSTQEMDQLFGQFQSAMAKVQSSPDEASTTLNAVAQSFSAIRLQLDQAYAQTSLEILPELSKTAAENADLSALAAQLADAAGSGDQARAQQIAAQLQKKQLNISFSDNAIDPWWRQQIRPLEQEYADLQAQEEAGDAEAVELYSARQ